jgi:chemotaxis protein MotB
MRRYNHGIPEQDNGTFNLSISDLMAGLLAIFILALAYFILNFSQNTAKLTQNNIVREELVTSLRDDIVQMGIKVDVDEKEAYFVYQKKHCFSELDMLR